MELVILILKVVFGFAAVMLSMALPGILIDLYFTKRAKDTMTDFCLNNGLDIEKIEVHKNHFGLRFKANNEKCYARFRVLKNKEIEWVGKVPDVIQSKAKQV